MAIRQHRMGIAVIGLLAACIAAQAAEVARPLPPFYPESPRPAAYDPVRFVRARDAVLVWDQTKVSEATLSERLPLNGVWRFSGLERAKAPFAEDADLGKGIQAPGFDDASWGMITVPSDFYLKHPSDVSAPYAKAWYRLAVDIPERAAGKRLILHFGVIGHEALLFVNGQRIGSHHGDFTPWDVDITAAVKPGTKAVIAIRVFSDLGPNGMVGASQIITTATHAYGCQYAKSTIKGGMWLPVELRVEPEVRIERAFIDPDLEHSAIAVRCEIINASTTEQRFDLVGTVVDARAKAPAASPAPTAHLASVTAKPGLTALSLRIPLTGAQPWTLEDPQLHNLILALTVEGKAVAAKGERFGYRSFRAEGDHFLLNGKRIYLFGESLIVDGMVAKKGEPELDQPELSPPVRAGLANTLLGFRSRGSNTVRLSEQPTSPALLEVADEVGMLIYDMWAWSYNGSLAPSFEQRNQKEVLEWLRRDYNHPSVVMWLGGNEVHLTQEVAAMFNTQTALIRSFERGGRPISAMSGLAARDYNQGIRLDTDLLDLHSYVGLSKEAWTAWERVFNRIYDQAIVTYAPGAKAYDKPFVIWELVGYSWGQKSSDYRPGDVDTYLKWARSPTAWAEPNGIGWAGSIGLAAALGKGSTEHAMEVIGRRVMEFVRQDTRVSGFAPWFLQRSIYLPATSLWTQPVYCGLRDQTGLPLRNVFAGRAYRQTAFVVNSTNMPHPGAVLRVSLVEADGSERPLAERILDAVPWTKAIGEVELTLPAAPGSRWAQIRLRLIDRDGNELSRNFYDVFVQDHATATASVEAPAALGVLSCKATGEPRLQEILAALKLAARPIAGPEGLAGFRTVVIPPSETALTINPAMQRALSDWVRKGGTLLVLEQSWTGEIPLLYKHIYAIPAVFADLVVPTHPVFAGLSQENFAFWNNPQLGQTGTHGYGPLSDGVIVARAPRLSEHDSFELLCEGRLDLGRMIASQLNACRLWDLDSAATVYVRNLLRHALAEPAATLRAWDENSYNFPVSTQAEMVTIDLRAKANMAFKDEVAGDGTGGWTDQGDNDFRMMPLGRQMIRGVPFDLIDPASNGGRSCVVVKDRPTGSFTAAATGIAVNEHLLRLFFIHGEAYADTGETLLYRINYADSQTFNLRTVHNQNISDWWYFTELTGAKVAITRTNPKGQEVGLHVMEWSNPRPGVAIASIDIVAPAGRPVVSMVVAITGEKAGRPTQSLTGDSWFRVSVDPGGVVAKTGPMVPAVEATPADGRDAIRITMPRRSEDGTKPVAFTRFLPGDAVAGLTGPYRYAVLEMKGRSGGTVELTLPDVDFTTKGFRKEIGVGIDAAFRTVRIPLDGMLAKPGELRGELYLFGLSDDREICFQVRNLRLE